MNWARKNRKIILISILFVGCMAVICALLYEPLMGFIKDPQSLKQQLNAFGIFGEIIMVFVMALQVIFVFLPGEIIEVMAGFLYGPIKGMIVCLLGATIGSTIIYYFVKVFGLKFIDHFIERSKLEQVEFLQNNEKLNMILFIIFLIPGTPKDIITYFIPLTNMKLSTFLLITSVARIPSVITSSISGNAIGMEQYEVSLLVFGITAIVSIIGLYYYKSRITSIRPRENL